MELDIVKRKKYKLLLDDSIEHNGHTLYRIQALRNFSDVKKGDIGGYIEEEYNLSHHGPCWVYDNAKVYSCASVCDRVKVYGDVDISDNICMSGKITIGGENKTHRKYDFIAFKNHWTSGEYFTWSPYSNLWSVDEEFGGTSKELIAKGYEESEQSGREYERAVRFVEKFFLNKE